MRARGFVTFRLQHPVEAPAAFFPIDAGTVLAVQRPGGLLRYRTVHGADHNLPPMNTLLIEMPDRLRDLNQSGAIDVHNAQGFLLGTNDQVEVARPAPLNIPIMDDAARAWNDSMLRITQREQARERQRADTRQQIDVNGNTFYIDAQINDEAMGNTTLTVTSASSDDSIGRLETGDGASYTWNPVTNSPVDTSVPYDRGDWTTWFHGRGLDHEGEPWVWRIRSSFDDARPCPACEGAARTAAERGIMVTRCSTICRRQIMVVPARAAEAEPVAQWTREPTLREVWAD